MSQWTANINVMIKAARRAGRLLMRDFGEVDKLQVSVKGTGEFVDRADRRSEEFLKEDLLEARANYGWCSAAAGNEPGSDPTRRWIISPLDGAANFLHGLPHWSLSVALEYKGEIVAAVVFNPMSEELFIAEKGSGCWLNDQRIRVSGRRDMAKLMLATSMPSANQANLPAALQDLARIAPICTGVRNWGTTSINLAYVAAGRYDGCWERNITIYNAAAGLLLIKEAGGLAQAFNVNENPLEIGNVIAGNNEVFEKVAKLVRNV